MHKAYFIDTVSSPRYPKIVLFDYQIDQRKLTRLALARGYPNLTAFAKKVGIHRNSLGEYLGGKGVFTSVVTKLAEGLDCSPLDFVQRRVLQVNIDQASKVLQGALERVVREDEDLCFLLIGSRARGTARELSDWDVGVTAGPRGLTAEAYLRLKGQIEDQVDNLPVGVDVVNLDAAPEWFLAGIDYQPRLLAGNEGSYLYLIGKIHGVRKAREDNEGAKQSA